MPLFSPPRRTLYRCERSLLTSSLRSCTLSDSSLGLRGPPAAAIREEGCVCVGGASTGRACQLQSARVQLRGQSVWHGVESGNTHAHS